MTIFKAKSCDIKIMCIISTWSRQVSHIMIKCTLISTSLRLAIMCVNWSNLFGILSIVICNAQYRHFWYVTRYPFHVRQRSEWFCSQWSCLSKTLKTPLSTVQITFIFIGQTGLVFGKCVCTCVTKHSNAFRTFLNWLKNSKRVWHEPKLHISFFCLFSQILICDLWAFGGFSFIQN